MAELEATEAIDPAKRQEWVEALRQADPKLLPLLIPTCRAYMALTRQAAERAVAMTEISADTQASGPSPGRPEAEAPFARKSPSAPPCPAPVDRVSYQEEARRATAALARHSEGDSPARPAPLPQEGRSGVSRPNRESTAEVPTTKPTPTPDRQRDAASEGVAIASYEPRAQADWPAHLAAAIEGLRASAGPAPQSPREVADHARLRLLYLAAGRRDDALEPIPSLDPSMQDFWSKELFGLATLTDTELISDPSRRTAEAKRSLDEALARLGEASPLLVHNLAFVRQVDSWGMYEPIEKYEFLPSQKAMLYAEVQNFKSSEGPRGYYTALRSSYQIFDSRGQRVAEHEFNTNEEYCRNPRHDYFFGYEFSLPKNVYPGKYILQLTVADLNNQKIGQSSIEFSVKQATE